MLPYLVSMPQLAKTSAIHGIPGYGVMMVLGFASAYALVNSRIRRFGMSPDQLIPLFIAAAVGGILGSRVLFFIGVDGLAQTILHPGKIFSFAAGGLAIYGGLIGGSAAVIGTILAMKLPVWKLADAIFPAVVIAMGLGRIGCFLAGCCHGDIVSLDPGAWSTPFLHGAVWVTSSFPFLALEFHDPDSVVSPKALLGQPLYPTQLWSAVASLLIGGFGIWLWNHRKFDGMVIGAMLTIEPWTRAFAELYRRDERGYVFKWTVSQVPSWIPPGMRVPTQDLVAPAAGHVLGITTSQTIGVIFLLVGVLILILRRNAGVGPEVEVEEEA